MFNPKPCLEIEIIINYNYLPPMDKIAKTNFVSCKKFEKCNQNEIYERKNDKCTGKTCNLRCKFLNTQYYFDDEISNFNKYISKDERVNFILIHQLDQLSKREDIKITYKNLVTGEELKSATALILKYFK